LATAALALSSKAWEERKNSDTEGCQKRVQLQNSIAKFNLNNIEFVVTDLALI
jgi:hypothetical protein